MNTNRYIKEKLKQYVWLFLAFFCMFFSGAVKKVMQLHAEEKISRLIHTDYDFTHPGTQSIKDGYREKHEVPAIVVSDNKQIPAAGFDPLMSLSASKGCYTYSNLHNCKSSLISYSSHESETFGSFPSYLFSHTLRV